MSLTKLKTALKKSWLDAETFYLKGQIASERHLQAIITHSLLSNSIFNQLFQLRIEPTLSGIGLSNLKGIKPDILILNSNEIVAHVEIKYGPGYIMTEKDFSSFQKSTVCRENCGSVYLDVNPKDCNWIENKSYPFSKNLVFIYMCLGHEDSDLFTKDEKIWKKLQNNIDVPVWKFYAEIGTSKRFYIKEVSKPTDLD